MTRLLDLGIERIRDIIRDMAKLSEKSVLTSIESYDKGNGVKKQIFEWSEKLRVLHNETSDLAIELIALYQPVATDLRFIKSSMEIAYGFFRFGRYAYDIVDVLETIGPLPNCDKTAILGIAGTVREMILLSVHSLSLQNQDMTARLYGMDDIVDAQYRRYLRELIAHYKDESKRDMDLRCDISGLLIFRYLERISDHACYISDSIRYIITGKSSPRR